MLSSREIARLAIGSLTLEPYLARQNSDNLPVLGQQSNKDKEIKLAAALGYAAHVTHNLAGYLGVPLKYPIQPANSHSIIISTPDPIVSAPYGRYDHIIILEIKVSCSLVSPQRKLQLDIKARILSCMQRLRRNHMNRQIPSSFSAAA